MIGVLGLVGATNPIPKYTIDLDVDPEHRYDSIFDVGPQFNTTVWNFYNQLAGDGPLLKVLYGISAKRGDYGDEQQGEINGLARLSGLPVEFVQSIQMLYELQTIMVPIVNFTGSAVDHPAVSELLFLDEDFEHLLRIPWRGPGCTGIIALNSDDGTVSHARNLDFSPVDVMGNLVFEGIFVKGGEEIFRSQMIAGYTMVITAYKSGEDGFALERNTRYSDHAGGYKEMVQNLWSGRDLNGWSLRKVLESTSTYDDAVAKITTVPYTSTEYAIISGVKKGTILARNPDNVAHTQTLGDNEDGDNYIIITNFDFFWKDVREWFDPTGGKGIFHPRRIYAQKVLDSAKTLTTDVLWEAINNEGTFADTIFQAIINVEKGLWNISQPVIPEIN